MSRNSVDSAYIARVHVESTIKKDAFMFEGTTL